MNESNISSSLLKNFSKKYKNSKILVTGGTSFLGNRIRIALQQVECDILFVGSKQCDLRDEQKTLDLFSNNFDIVIHAAAIQGGLGYILSNPTKIFIDNMKIHTNVIKACALNLPKILIGIGSSCSYPGNRSDMKEDEFWDGILDESVLSYGFTKKSFFIGQYNLFKEFKISGAHLVLNNMYGPNDNFDPEHAHVVADLIRKFFQAKKDGTAVHIWGDGNAEREFLFVDDAVEGILRSILFLDGFTLLNVAHGIPTKIQELVAILCEVFNYSNIKFDDNKPIGAKRKSLNSAKCKNILGWIPSTHLKDGIKETVKWYKN